MTKLLLISLASALAAQTNYDLLLQGGRVIDPKNAIDARMDLAIANGRIARVAAAIPASEARRVINVSGLLVTPGLIDIHVHVYAGTGQRGAYSGDNSIYPDGFTFRSGVTTVVDAGSSGWRNFGEFRDQMINRSKTRVLAMLNIVGSGMGGRPDVEQNTKDMEPEPTAEVAKRHKDVVVGIKTAHYEGPEWIAVERAVEAGTLANVPVMVDLT
jgi:dihydroorotase